jgi:TrmH family RNA methyltransferase
MISKANIQLVKSLQDKKQRQKYNQFVVEGEKSITELLKSPFETVKLYAVSEFLDQNHQYLKSVSCEEVTEKELKQMSSHMSPQKAIALVRIPQEDSIPQKTKLILALDEIQDPGNLGTIIRIADWYGIEHIVCSKGCTDVFSPKCINSTMGSFLRVKVHYQDIIEIANQTQLPLMVAVLEGQNIHQGSLPKEGILVIGNEGHGVNGSIISKAKHKLTIPRYGGAESLNAAISTAIILDNLIKSKL